MREEARQAGIEHCGILDRERLRIELDSPAGFFVRFQHLGVPLSEAEQKLSGALRRPHPAGGFDRLPADRTDAQPHPVQLAAVRIRLRLTRLRARRGFVLRRIFGRKLHMLLPLTAGDPVRDAGPFFPPGLRLILPEPARLVRNAQPDRQDIVFDRVQLEVYERRKYPISTAG
jgi:hypothetical protein